MVTSQFIRCGKDNSMVFNVTYIASILKQQTLITEHNLKSYQKLSFPVAVGDTAYSVAFLMAGRAIQEQELYYETKALRDAMFEQIMQTINPLVIAQPDLIREEASDEPNAPKA